TDSGRRRFPRRRSAHPRLCSDLKPEFPVPYAVPAKEFPLPACANSFPLRSVSPYGCPAFPGSAAVCPFPVPAPSAEWTASAAKGAAKRPRRKYSVPGPQPENIEEHEVPCPFPPFCRQYITEISFIEIFYRWQ